MIEELKKLINDGDVNEFKETFEKSTVNAHHRELLYEITFRKQSLELCDYMDLKANVAQESRSNIFFNTLVDRVAIKDFKYIEGIEDMHIAQGLSKHVKNLVQMHDDAFLIKFMDQKPISTFMNFKRILFYAFYFDRKDFIKHATEQRLDKNLVFYSGLCAIKFKQRKIFSDLLMRAAKYNRNIFDEVRKLKNDHSKMLKQKANSKKEVRDEVDEFITQILIETFARHLEEELAIKKPLDDGQVKTKRTKV